MAFRPLPRHLLDKEKSMLLIYTGNGKGKTSALVGQAIRAIGQNFVVSFGQFMKRDEQAGEQRMLQQLVGDRYHVQGQGFLTKPEQYPAHRKVSLALIEWARNQLAEVDMLLLDEALYALSAELLLAEELRELIALSREHACHLVLSGRGCPGWLEEEADLVTEMVEHKHHYAQGIPAQKGIEF